MILIGYAHRLAGGFAKAHPHPHRALGVETRGDDLQGPMQLTAEIEQDSRLATVVAQHARIRQRHHCLITGAKQPLGVRHTLLPENTGGSKVGHHARSLA